MKDTGKRSFIDILYQIHRQNDKTLDYKNVLSSLLFLLMIILILGMMFFDFDGNMSLVTVSGLIAALQGVNTFKKDK